MSQLEDAVQNRPQAEPVDRADHIWFKRSSFEQIINAINTGNAGALKKEYERLDNIFDEAQRRQNEWWPPEVAFEILQKAGVVGVGGSAEDIAILHARLADGDADSEVLGAFLFVARGVFSAASMTFSILKMIRRIIKFLQKDVSVSGFVINDSGKDVKFYNNHLPPGVALSPYLKNSIQTLGPSTVILPKKGQVFDPLTNKSYESVAVSTWAIENDSKNVGAFATATAEGPTDSFAVGWGVPVRVGPIRTIIDQSSVNAEHFWDMWDRSKGLQKPHFVSRFGASLIYEDVVKKARIGRFGTVIV
jgi:hypothetical protein